MSDTQKSSITLGTKEATRLVDTPTEGDPTDTEDTGKGTGEDTGGNTPPVLRVWTSGDWHTVARSSAPFNGLKISAEIGIGEVPGDVKVTFDDYTCDKDGVSTTIPKITGSDGWVDVPQPAKKDNTSRKFTVTGQVCIQSEVNGRFLWIKLSYGLQTMERDEIGFIFSVDQ